MRRSRSRTIACYSTCSWIAALLVALPAGATDVTIADVTTRAFSVISVADEPVSDASVRVFADVDGLSEITGDVSIALNSTGLTLGIAKVEVSGLQSASCVYIQAETTTSGVTLEPSAPPFLQVCTASETSKSNAAGELIMNDLIRHDLHVPGGGSSAGALILLSAPESGGQPISAFAGDGYALPSVVGDLNNIFDAATSSNADISEGEVLQILEVRGLLCPGLADHQLLRFRRAPGHEEVPTVGHPITQLEPANACFFADTVCDGSVDVLDVQRVLNRFGSSSAECAFNPDLDVVTDATINILDVQSVLNRFGEAAPFTP